MLGMYDGFWVIVSVGCLGESSSITIYIMFVCMCVFGVELVLYGWLNKQLHNFHYAETTKTVY